MARSRVNCSQQSKTRRKKTKDCLTGFLKTLRGFHLAICVYERLFSRQPYKSFTWRVSPRTARLHFILFFLQQSVIVRVFDFQFSPFNEDSVSHFFRNIVFINNEFYAKVFVRLKKKELETSTMSLHKEKQRLIQTSRRTGYSSIAVSYYLMITVLLRD